MKKKGYRKTVKKTTEKMMNDLETAFKKKWQENDETLNGGDIIDEEQLDDEFDW